MNAEFPVACDLPLFVHSFVLELTCIDNMFSDSSAEVVLVVAAAAMF